jgi:hypothetical protein
MFLLQSKKFSCILSIVWSYALYNGGLGLMRKNFVICPGCDRKLFQTAICIHCENAKREEEYKELFKNVCRILEDSGLKRRKMPASKRRPSKK